MSTHDRLGRWLFTSHTKSPIKNFNPDGRQLRWMQFLNLHGMASSQYLHESTTDTHRCSQTSKRQLRKLFDGQMVFKPHQQRETEGADANHHIYALTQTGIDHLRREGLWVDALKPSGPWVHQFMISSITATMDILSKRNGFDFIPGHEITSDLANNIPFQWNGKWQSCKLIPDSLFAIRYGKGFIAYALEADRKTEPNDPKTPYRKSTRRTVKQYAELIRTKSYKKHFGLNCPLVVLNITVSEQRINNALAIVDEEIGACSYLTYGVVKDFRTPFQPPRELLTHLFEGSLLRNGKEPFTLKFSP